MNKERIAHILYGSPIEPPDSLFPDDEVDDEDEVDDKNRPDIFVDGCGFCLVVACKDDHYRHHNVLDDVRLHYLDPNQTEAVVTRSRGTETEYITVPLAFFKTLIDENRRLRQTGKVIQWSTHS